MGENEGKRLEDLPKHEHECFEMKGSDVCLVCLMEEWADGSLHPFPGREEMLEDRMRFDDAKRRSILSIALARGDNAALQAHDEAMRMQALAIGARLVPERRMGETDLAGQSTERVAAYFARWAYREATGREW